MGIAKRSFGDALIVKSHCYDDLDNDSSEASSTWEEVGEIEDDINLCKESELLVDGQADIRSYLVPGWRWQKPVEDFTGEEEAAETFGLPFHLDAEAEPLAAEVAEAIEAMEHDAEPMSADEEAAKAMGLPLHAREDADITSPEYEELVEEPGHAMDTADTAADEEAAREMGLPFHTRGEGPAEKAEKAATEKGSLGTPARRRPLPLLETTPCKKPRLADPVNPVQPSVKLAVKPSESGKPANTALTTEAAVQESCAVVF